LFHYDKELDPEPNCYSLSVKDRIGINLISPLDTATEDLVVIVVDGIHVTESPHGISARILNCSHVLWSLFVLCCIVLRKLLLF